MKKIISALMSVVMMLSICIAAFGSTTLVAEATYGTLAELDEIAREWGLDKYPYHHYDNELLDERQLEITIYGVDDCFKNHSLYQIPDDVISAVTFDDDIEVTPKSALMNWEGNTVHASMYNGGVDNNCHTTLTLKRGDKQVRISILSQFYSPEPLKEMLGLDQYPTTIFDAQNLSDIPSGYPTEIRFPADWSISGCFVSSKNNVVSASKLANGACVKTSSSCLTGYWVRIYESRGILPTEVFEGLKYVSLYMPISVISWDYYDSPNRAHEKCQKVCDDYGITDDMTDMEKMERIIQFACEHDYSAITSSGDGLLSLYYHGYETSGDCWAWAEAIQYLAWHLNIPVALRGASSDLGAGANHINNYAILDGKYCIVDCGATGSAPRPHKLLVYDTPWEYGITSDGDAVITNNLLFVDVKDTIFKDDIYGHGTVKEPVFIEATVPEFIDGHKVIAIVSNGINKSKLAKVYVPEGVNIDRATLWKGTEVVFYTPSEASPVETTTTTTGTTTSETTTTTTTESTTTSTTETTTSTTTETSTSGTTELTTTTETTTATETTTTETSTTTTETTSTTTTTNETATTTTTETATTTTTENTTTETVTTTAETTTTAATDEEDSTLPQTGNNSPVECLAAVLALMAVIGGAFILRTSRNENEGS